MHRIGGRDRAGVMGWAFRGSCPVEARFTAPVPNGSEAHSASCTMGTGSLLGLKRPGRGV